MNIYISNSLSVDQIYNDFRRRGFNHTDAMSIARQSVLGAKRSKEFDSRRNDHPHNVNTTTTRLGVT